MIRHYFCPPCAIGGGGCNKDFKTQLKFPKLAATRDLAQRAQPLNNCISFETSNQFASK